MRSGEGIAGIFQVVKFRVEPGVHRMTALAGRRETQGHMIDDRRLKVLLMAGVACRRQADELSCSGIRVAIVALQQSVRPDQGKPILVIAYLLQRNLPTLDRVAAFAVGAELATMDIRVTVLALIAGFSEHEVTVAVLASNTLVHPTQRETSFTMIEL